MTYTPTQWKDGDLVTSAKLNKLEQGVAAGGGAFFVHCTYTYDKEEDDWIYSPLDKTWNEISEVAESGPVILAMDMGEDGKAFTYLSSLYILNNEYYCAFLGSPTIDFFSSSPDGELSIHHDDYAPA